MQEAEKHYHAWILHIDMNEVALQPMPGEYTSDLKCRRHGIKAAGGDREKVVVLLCRGGAISAPAITGWPHWQLKRKMARRPICHIGRLKCCPPRATKLSRRTGPMGTDYHRATTESIPAPDQLPRESPGQPAQNPGAQLPHTDLVHQERQLNPDNAPYPGLLDRDQWATEQIIRFKFNLAEGAVLRRICFYAGTPQGCWAGIDRIALETSCHEKTVRRAITTLRKHNVLLQGPWKDRVRTLLLNFTVTPTPPEDSGLSARSQLTDTGLSARSEPADSGLSARSTEDNQPVDSGHSARSGPDDIGLSARSGPTDSGHSVHDSGHSARLTGKNKKEEREEIDSLSLLSGSLSGSPGRESEVLSQNGETPAPHAGVVAGARPKDDYTPEGKTARDSPTPVRDSGVVDQQKPTHDEVRGLVVQNWTLLATTGWDFMQGAVRHYEEYGLDYLRQDLRIRKDKLDRQEVATRTCSHCGMVHETPEGVRTCAKCNQPKCVSEQSPCYRTGCDGDPRGRNQSRPRSRQRR